MCVCVRVRVIRGAADEMDRAGRTLTLFDEENELFGHEDERQSEENILLREMGKRSGEHAADTVF